MPLRHARGDVQGAGRRGGDWAWEGHRESRDHCLGTEQKPELSPGSPELRAPTGEQEAQEARVMGSQGAQSMGLALSAEDSGSPLWSASKGCPLAWKSGD